MSTDLDLYELETKIGEKVAEIDKKVALLEQKIDLLMSNHMHHLQQDVSWLKGVLYAAVGGLVVNLIGIIAILAKMNL
jgi:tetrahydromethanopterin S-methyltransferase subunit G